jgi:hypothetical protein
MAAGRNTVGLDFGRGPFTAVAWGNGLGSESTAAFCAKAAPCRQAKAAAPAAVNLN